MRSGDLLIEVERAAQAVQLYQLTDLKFNGQSLPIKVEPHRSLNSCKGVARNFEFKIFESDEEIADCLAPQGVTHCKRIIIKRDGQKITTDDVSRMRAAYLEISVKKLLEKAKCFSTFSFGRKKNTHVTKTAHYSRTCGIRTGIMQTLNFVEYLPEGKDAIVCTLQTEGNGFSVNFRMKVQSEAP
ncbi:hypothetical protein CAPTEDRAFT_203066 [Capitella teleta]|uniref:Uncharacterized protein n=1 Tax=Capitella teleta TaxID=283909 RepID=R7UAZ9_CAPTE|nr:hypothetical protein CAPTEDRAFT_203066 [Capitella teleta]|eukprot:ELU03311.1 hypothetical protein CAPTEDRAFT_203066 [Capitella teleta]